MRWLIHLFAVLALAAGATYAMFFVNLAGKNLFAHLSEVWSSPVVQQKVDLVEDSITQKLTEKFIETKQQVAKKNAERSVRLAPDQVTKEDRESLKQLLNKVAKTAN